MYTCGPTVYQRIHIGNARPFVISMWLRRWLAVRGYDVNLVENITDVNDKIYNAAPGHSAELAAQASQWYAEDTDFTITPEYLSRLMVDAGDPRSEYWDMMRNETIPAPASV